MSVAAPAGIISRRAQWHAVTASFLGWTLDAFDFVVVVFLVDTLAEQFHVSKSAIVWTFTATLAMPPPGAWLFPFEQIHLEYSWYGAGCSGKGTLIG